MIRQMLVLDLPIPPANQADLKGEAPGSAGRGAPGDQERPAGVLDRGGADRQEPPVMTSSSAGDPCSSELNAMNGPFCVIVLEP